MTDTSAFRELYPFESRWLDTPHGRLHYVDEGPRDRPALLMVHGNPTWSFYYRNLIREFRGEHRVIALDHLGCGLSDKPQDFAYTLAAHIENLELLVSQLGLQKFTLVVHDWGGAIGMGYAVRHPETIERTVVFNTAAFPADRIPLSIDVCRIPGFGALAIRGLNAFARAALIRAVHHKDRFDARVRAGYLAPYDSWHNRVAHLRFVQDIPMRREHPTYAVLEDIDRGLGQLTDRPMLIVWGAKDFVFNDWFLEQWRQRFPAATVEYVEDAAHYVVEDAHERIVGWMRAFLNG